MGTTPLILLVDDDQEASESLLRALRVTLEEEVLFSLCTSAAEMRTWLKKNSPLVAVVDLCLDEAVGVQSGFDAIAHLRASSPQCRIIVLTGHASRENGVQAMEHGAASFLQKPANLPHLSALIRDGLSQAQLRVTLDELQHEREEGLFGGFVGESDAAKRVREELEYAAFAGQPLLITGETGTGKGLSAKIVHRASKRRKSSFVRYQPTIAGADLVMSDLFGHAKGAFTGADAARQGLLEEANGGTLFLDEIDELPPAVQVALLGTLQDKTFRPVGLNREQQSDFRLICATNADPEACVASGKMRRDFFHRIAHLQLHLPPLRERTEDISLIAQQALQKLSDEEGVSIRGLDKGALRYTHQYQWPGNVRELLAAVEGAAYRAAYKKRDFISAEDFPRKREAAKPLSFTEQIEEFKRMLVLQALHRNGGNKVQAAKELGLDRSTIRRILGRGVS